MKSNERHVPGEGTVKSLIVLWMWLQRKDINKLLNNKIVKLLLQNACFFLTIEVQQKKNICFSFSIHRVWQRIDSTIYKTFLGRFLCTAWRLQTCSGNRNTFLFQLKSTYTALFRNENFFVLCRHLIWLPVENFINVILRVQQFMHWMLIKINCKWQFRWPISSKISRINRFKLSIVFHLNCFF